MKKITSKIVLQLVLLVATTTQLFAQINSMKQNRVSSSVGSQVAAMSFVKEGTYFFKINETNKYLGIEGISQNNGARLMQWDFANQDNHKFLVSRTADGYYLIKAVHSNKYLNVAGQSTDDGSIICQWDYVDQDNLKWAFYYNKFSNSYTIRNKQSSKELKLQTNSSDVNNGVLLNINSNTAAQTFTLQEVNMMNTMGGNPKKSTQLQSEVSAAITAMSAVQIRLDDGTIIYRSINPQNIKVTTVPVKKELQSTGDGECVTKTAKIDMDTKSDVPVTASTYLEYNAPGLIYDTRRFYSGDYTNKQEFPNAENRTPINILTTVRNMQGNIYEAVELPTKTSINQAIKNLQYRYTTDPLQTTNQSLIYKSSYIESNTEMQLKLGASAHYMTGSFSADMQVKSSKQVKTFFIEADKELFTLSVDKPQNGFFNAEVPLEGNYGYISQVSYGVKVIGKIEVDNSVESLGTEFTAMIEGGFAGGRFDFASFSQKSHKNIKCFFYVVGGVSEEVVGINASDVYYKINEILRTVNYKTCMPIRIKFSQITTGNTITYKDATNNFNYEVCTPKAIAEANKDYAITINSLTAIGTDIQLYGGMWVEMWSPTYGDLSKYRTTNNSLFGIRQQEHLEYRDLGSYNSFPSVQYKNIPANIAKDAEIHIYYNLWDYDEIGANSDDLLRLRGGSMFVTKTTLLAGIQVPTEQFYRRVIPIKDWEPNNSGRRILLVDDMVDGDGVKITYSCTEMVQQPKR